MCTYLQMYTIIFLQVNRRMIWNLLLINTSPPPPLSNVAHANNTVQRLLEKYKVTPYPNDLKTGDIAFT